MRIIEKNYLKKIEKQERKQETSDVASKQKTSVCQIVTKI